MWTKRKRTENVEMLFGQKRRIVTHLTMNGRGKRRVVEVSTVNRSPVELSALANSLGNCEKLVGEGLTARRPVHEALAKLSQT